MAHGFDDFMGVVVYFSVQVLHILMFLTFLFGVLLFAAPSLMKKLNQRTSETISMRKPLKPVEIMRETNPILEKYRMPIGIIFLLGALEVLYFCLFRMDSVSFSKLWTGTTGLQAFLEVGFETARIVFIFGAGIAVLTMAAFTFAPELYKKIADKADGWLSTRMALLPLEKERYVEGTIFFKHHKLFGLMIFGLSLFAILQMMGLPDRFGW